jgi:hypothetical protein
MGMGSFHKADYKGCTLHNTNNAGMQTKLQ